MLQKHNIPVRTGDYVIGNSHSIYKIGDIDSEESRLLSYYSGEWNSSSKVKFEDWNKE